MKKIIYLLLLIPIFFSCEKDANVEIPVSKPQLVAACFVGANEDTVRLKLSWSSPIFYSSSNNLENEKGASVILSKGNQQYPMIWSPNSETYIATNTNFIAGDEINLNITFQTENIKSSCVIPTAPDYTMTYTGTKVVHNDGWESSYLEYNFTNNRSDETSYYRILFKGYYFDDYDNTTHTQQLWCKTGEMFSLTKGESTNLEVYYYSYEESSKIDSVKYYIIHCNDDYYKYHKSISNYMGDDFFTEPSIIYSNIESGLGIFSSYNMVSDTTILKK